MKSLLLASLVCLSATLAQAVEPAAVSPELNRVLSRVQAMGHGTYTEREWTAVQAEVDRVVAGAEAAGRWNDALEAFLIKAMMQADMKRDDRGALALLQEARARYDQHRVPAMRKVFVREAQSYGSLGDDAAVRRVMEAFKASPYYDPEFYSYVAHEGRNTPVSVMRPGAGASDSTALTAMRVSRQQSQFAPGALFPAFKAVDTTGHERTMESYRGKVLLLDFWVRGWTPWERDLENVQRLYRRYQPEGFEVLGICLEPAPTDAAAFALSQGIRWPQVAGDTVLSRHLGIYGGAANYLVDRDGQIIARNLRGADLAATVKRALAR